MLSSRSISIHRDYTDSHNSNFSSTKTPGRALKGRAGLQENTFQHGSLTTNPKEKRAILQTPFKRNIGKNALQESLGSKQTILASRPLVDKTPLPNRQNLSFLTPLPQKGKFAQLELPPLVDEAEAGTPARPPSSSRKSLRAPRSSIKNYETPDTKGDHWNVSDISIHVGETSLDKVDELDADEPDYSDPEYMPPKPVDVPYEPPFDMPDYKLVGKALMTLAHSCPVEELRPPSELNDIDILEGCFSPSAMDLHVPDIEDDDIFAPQTTKIAPKQVSARSTGAAGRVLQRPEIHTANRALMTKQSRSGPQPTPPARPATSAAIRPSMSRLASTVPRPGTSASNKRPVLSTIRTGATSLINSKTCNAGGAAVPQSRVRRLDDDLIKTFSKDSLAASELCGDFHFEV